MKTERVVLATANPDKAREISAILATAGLDLVTRPADVPEVEETADTLEANARLKAEALCRATGLPALADDTGLEVAALGGAPGVHSARYAGVDSSYGDNVDKLLRELDSTRDRRARFRTVALLVYPDGREVIAEGVVDGTITEAARGANGFGYDPIFAVNGKTMAEMEPAEKHVLSHRGRAFRALAALLAGS